MVVPLATSMVTVLRVIRVGRRCWRFLVWVLWVALSVGVLQVWCRVDGGVPGDGVVSAEAGSDPRGHLWVIWGVYLCAGKPPLADIILSHSPDLT